VALVPYADLFNHNPFANSYIDARQQGFFTKTDEVVVYADRSYKKMEQVCPYCRRARVCDVCLFHQHPLVVTPSICKVWGLGISDPPQHGIIRLCTVRSSLTF